MKRTIGLIILALTLLSTSVFAEEVKIWNSDTLHATGKLYKFTTGFKDRALQPFNPASNAMKGVMEKMAEAGVKNATISYEGERKENANFFGIKSTGGTYYVVEAWEITFSEPTRGNIEAALAEHKLNHDETMQALALLRKSDFAKEVAPSLIALVKKRKNDKDGIGVTEELLKAYADITQKEGIPELLKVFKFHPLDPVQIAAGKLLIQLGTTNEVEEIIAKGDKKDTVKKAMKNALMN
jgi:hypothetical protein